MPAFIDEKCTSRSACTYVQADLDVRFSQRTFKVDDKQNTSARVLWLTYLQQNNNKYPTLCYSFFHQSEF